MGGSPTPKEGKVTHPEGVFDTPSWVGIAMTHLILVVVGSWVGVELGLGDPRGELITNHLLEQQEPEG